MKKNLVIFLSLLATTSSFASYNPNGVGSEYMCEVLKGETVTVRSQRAYVWNSVLPVQNYTISIGSITNIPFVLAGKTYSYKLVVASEDNSEVSSVEATLINQQQTLAYSVFSPVPVNLWEEDYQEYTDAGFIAPETRLLLEGFKLDYNMGECGTAEQVERCKLRLSCKTAEAIENEQRIEEQWIEASEDWNY